MITAPSTPEHHMPVGSRLSRIGMALGLAGASAGTRLLEAFLWHTEARDPGAFAMGAILLMGVVLLASYVPARRATRVDPAASLKAE